MPPDPHASKYHTPSLVSLHPPTFGDACRWRVKTSRRVISVTSDGYGRTGENMVPWPTKSKIQYSVLMRRWELSGIDQHHVLLYGLCGRELLRGSGRWDSMFLSKYIPWKNAKYLFKPEILYCDKCPIFLFFLLFNLLSNFWSNKFLLVI